jgi:molecular chaperone HtpG
VLLMDGPLDTHFISKLEQKMEKVAFKRIDADIAEKLIEKDETISHVLSEDEAGKVKTIFERAISKPNMTVSVESLSPDDLPVTITMDEFMRRMKDMSKMGGPMNFYGMMPDNYKVAINGNHKLVSRILSTTNEDEQNQLAKHTFDLALLSQGMLTGSDLTNFLNRSVSMI